LPEPGPWCRLWSRRRRKSPRRPQSRRQWPYPDRAGSHLSCWHSCGTSPPGWSGS